MIKLQTCKFIEKRLQHWCFPLHVKKFLRTPILKNIRERLFLIILLVLSNLFVFGCLFTMVKKNCSLRWRKYSLKLDYGIKWCMLSGFPTMGGGHPPPPSNDFFWKPPSKLMPPMGYPPYKNEDAPIWKTTPPPSHPPLKHEVPFHEIIPRKGTVNNNLKSS